MATDNDAVFDEPGVQPSDSSVAAGFIRPAVAYEEPEFVTVVVPAAVWTRVVGRDIQRSIFVLFKTPGYGEMQIRSGTNPVAVPFYASKADNIFSLRYVDFLTMVTGEFFAYTALGETITIGTVRQH